MPINFTQAQRENLLNNLQTGRQNAIRARDLARLINFPIGGNQEKLRQLIKECIEQDGDLIGAATGRIIPGFFIIETIVELNNYLDSLERRTRSDNERRTALIESWNNQNNQIDTDRQTLNIQ